MNNRPIQVVVLFFVILLGVIVFFSYEMVQKERQSTLRKEGELAAKVSELSQSRSQITILTQEKSELMDKITSLESSITQHEENIKSLSEQVERLNQAKESLQSELLGKNSQTSQLTRKILMLESGKEEFMQTIHQLEEQKKELENQVRGSSSTTGDAQLPGGAATLNSVDLGQIIVRTDLGLRAQVEQVNTAYNFVVLNVGLKNGMKKGDIVNIVRDDVLIAKAVIQQVREDSSAAILLPEWVKKPIEKGDLVTRFS